MSNKQQIDNEIQEIYEFDIRSIEPSSSWIVLGPPGVGKSSFIEDLVKFNKDKYPVCRVVCSAPGPNKRYCKIFPPLFVCGAFKKEKEENFIKRQLMLATKKTKSKYCVYILDDIDIHKSQFRTPFFFNLFKQGSRHWHMLTIVVNQYALEFPPEMRSAASYIVIFRYTSNEDRKKIYNNFGGSSIFKNEKNFNYILDELTGDHQCLIIKQNANTNELSKCVFYYQTSPQTNWEFGTKQIWKLSEKRCSLAKQYNII